MWQGRLLGLRGHTGKLTICILPDSWQSKGTHSAQVGGHTAADCSCATVMPDNCVVQRLARVPVPNQGRLALVGDPYCNYADIARSLLSGCQRTLNAQAYAVPQLERVMLAPPARAH